MCAYLEFWGKLSCTIQLGFDAPLWFTLERGGKGKVFFAREARKLSPQFTPSQKVLVFVPV